MEWFFWMVAIWFAVGLMGRGACSRRGWRAYEARRLRAHRAGHWHLDRYTAVRDASPTLGRPRASKRAVPEPKETPEERIRRRFVEGRIDLDRYEAELWEELRPK